MKMPTTSRRARQFSCLLLAWLLGGEAESTLAVPPTSPQSAAHVRPLPPFTLTDTRGRPRRLTDFRGRPVAVFFFCGCPWCQSCAETWGRLQRGGALTPPAGVSPHAPVMPPITLMVFSGGTPAAQAFASRAGLDPSQTVLLPDPNLRVTAASHADPCPRVFVLNSQGRLRYTNDHKDDAARQAPALAIASRALDALRAGDAPALRLSASAALEITARQARRHPCDAVGLAEDEWDTPAAPPAWLHSHPQSPGLIMTIDATHEAEGRYNVLPLPDECVLDREGRVRAHGILKVTNKPLPRRHESLSRTGLTTGQRARR